MRGKLYSQRILDRWVDKPTKTLFGSGYAGLGIRVSISPECISISKSIFVHLLIKRKELLPSLLSN